MAYEKPKYIYLLIITVLVVISCLSNCHRCDRQTSLIVKQDTLTPLINTNKAENLILDDSLTIYREMAKKAQDVKVVIKWKYKTVYDSVYLASDSSDRINLALVNLEKERLDSAYNNELEAVYFICNNQGKQINNYKENEAYYDMKVKKDSVVIDSLTNIAIPEAYKQGKKKGFWNGVKVGVPVGGALTKGAEIGVQAIRP